MTTRPLTSRNTGGAVVALAGFQLSIGVSAVRFSSGKSPVIRSPLVSFHSRWVESQSAVSAVMWPMTSLLCSSRSMTSNTSMCAGVVAVPSTPTRARFDGLGQAGQTVLLTLTPPTGNVLVSGTNTVTVNSMSLDQSGATTRVIGSGGNFSVYVGGDFGIAANQPNGVYSALFTLTADYQ